MAAAAAAAASVEAATAPRVLCVLATVKDESTVIREWLEHYLWQGVQHFFLIDNGSSDGDALRAVVASIDPALVTLASKPRPHAQIEHYNEMLPLVRQYAWCLVVDVDEYVYARAPVDTLRAYASRIPARVNSVLLQWHLFTSSGHVRQPPSIRKGFTWTLHGSRDLSLHPGYYGDVKALVRTESVVGLRNHLHVVRGGKCTSVLERDALQLNHYQIMSREYFASVKMRRGDARGVDLVRDWAYFAQRDTNVTEDTELAQLVRAAEEADDAAPAEPMERAAVEA